MFAMSDRLGDGPVFWVLDGCRGWVSSRGSAGLPFLHGLFGCVACGNDAGALVRHGAATIVFGRVAWGEK